ncbi:MAG: hypothetical protein K6G16_10295 [Lachnospiraceae bacterium]|nr:hypothetical protein [Lachnospiraceae bacterium]
MSILKDLQEKKEKAEKERAREEARRYQLEKYASYYAVEPQVRAAMEKLPPDYPSVVSLLDGLEERGIPVTSVNWPLVNPTMVYALSLILAGTASEGSFEQAEQVMRVNVHTSPDHDYAVRDVLTCMIHGYETTGWESFKHFRKGADIHIHAEAPAFFRVLPALCRQRVGDCYYTGKGAEKDPEEAAKIYRSLVNDAQIPEEYPEYRSLINDLRAIEEIFRREEEFPRLEYAYKGSYGKKLKGRIEEILMQVPRDYLAVYQLFSDHLDAELPKDLRETYTEQIREEKFRVEGATDRMTLFIYAAGKLLPEDGIIYLVASIWDGVLQKNDDLTEEERTSYRAAVQRLYQRIDPQSPSLYYYRAELAPPEKRSGSWSYGARAKADHSVLDPNRRTICAYNYAESLYEQAAQMQNTEDSSLHEAEEKLDEAAQFYLQTLQAVQSGVITKIADVALFHILTRTPAKINDPHTGETTRVRDLFSDALWERGLTVLREQLDDRLGRTDADRPFARAVQLLLDLSDDETDGSIWKAALFADDLPVVLKERAKLEILKQTGEIWITKGIDEDWQTCLRSLPTGMLAETGDTFINESGEKNRGAGFLYCDAWLSLFAHPTKESSIPDQTLYDRILENACSFCIRNDMYERALSYGMVDPVHAERTMLWALSQNSGYFLTDDRPDSHGRHSDHGRVQENAWLATSVYDGVLG